MRKILVSGCLGDSPIRFNETCVPVESEIWERWVTEGRLVPVCPELAAGFPVPRPPAEIVGGTAAMVLTGDCAVMEDTGLDVSDPFVEGARVAVELAIEQGCEVAVLTDGSPSCGTTYVYDGAFGGDTIKGMGVLAQLLHDRGVAVFPHDQLHLADEFLRSAT